VSGQAGSAGDRAVGGNFATRNLLDNGANAHLGGCTRPNIDHLASLSRTLPDQGLCRSAFAE
jgi:hypothetical protein